MGAIEGLNIVTDGLEFYIDSSNYKSYVSGSTIQYDLVGTQDLTLNNSVSYSTNNLGTLEFDGLDDNCQTVNIYNRSETMSWDVWFMRTGDNSTYNMPFSHFLPYLGFRSNLISSPNKFHFSFATKLLGITTQRHLYSNSSYLENTWYNVCCTLEINTSTGTADAKMYVNGELENSLNLPGTVDELYNVAYELRIGNHRGASYPFEGKIPNLKIYNKILNADEVRQNFNATKTRFGI